MPDQPVTPQESLRQELERILRSREFSRAEYLCRFLRCCVEETLSGNISQLKEFWLGRSVFQRDKSFNPSSDPIVRVQARRLRQKLDRYYENEGRESRVRIVLPVGTYVPHFLTGDQLIASAAPRRKALSVAVLPFVALEEDTWAPAFAAILTDELIHRTVETGKFLVVSRLSSSRYKNATDDVRTIGKALNADLLIEGRVRGETGSRTVSVQLTDAASGYHLWSASFQCSGAPSEDDANAIARRIAKMLETGNAPATSGHARVDLKT
jgi:TolB-like protein